MTKDFLAKEIFSRYGTIKRARGNFLYTAKGIRLTDMYLEGGRAILGWGGSSAFTQLKNVLSRGITGSFITDYDFRLDKAVSQLLNSPRKAFVFQNKEIAVTQAANLTKEKICFWKPWAPCADGEDFMKAEVVLVEPPYAWAEELVLAAVLEENDCPAKDTAGLQTVKLPAPETACIVRSIYNLIEALQCRQEKDWFIYDQLISKYWLRKGPYLYPKMPEEKYDSFVKHCLDCNIVISPEYETPSIIPFGADKGVFSFLKKKPFNC